MRIEILQLAAHQLVLKNFVVFNLQLGPPISRLQKQGFSPVFYFL